MKVFEPGSIGTLELKNRIIRSATGEGMSDERGFPKRDLTDLYLRLAKGEAGAIITGVVGVQADGRVPNMPFLHSDEYIHPYREMNTELQEHGTPIIVQLGHGGANIFLDKADEMSVGPSAYTEPPFNLRRARALSDEEIRKLVDSFVMAIARAKKAGFRGVQLHAAHGYLLQEFLSPRINRRLDTWGGSVENRFRVIGEIVHGAREKVDMFPILVKYSAYDYDKGGISLDEGLRIAELMQKSGVDAIEVSCGGMLSGFSCVRTSRPPIEAMMEYIPQLKSQPVIKRFLGRTALRLAYRRYPQLHNYNVSAAEKVKHTVDIPVIVVGGIRKLGDIEDIIANNRADFVSMCRPFVIEPNIVQKMRSGQQTESRCIDCGYCLYGLFSGTLRCHHGKIGRSGTTHRLNDDSSSS